MYIHTVTIYCFELLVFVQEMPVLFYECRWLLLAGLICVICYCLWLFLFLRCVIPVVCVTNEREESVVNQHNLFRKMLYSNNEITCFGL